MPVRVLSLWQSRKHRSRARTCRGSNVSQLPVRFLSRKNMVPLTQSWGSLMQCVSEACHMNAAFNRIDLVGRERRGMLLELLFFRDRTSRDDKSDSWTARSWPLNSGDAHKNTRFMLLRCTTELNVRVRNTEGNATVDAHGFVWKAFLEATTLYSDTPSCACTRESISHASHVFHWPLALCGLVEEDAMFVCRRFFGSVFEMVFGICGLFLFYLGYYNTEYLSWTSGNETRKYCSVTLKKLEYTMNKV